jgi:hypothetical protein
MRQIRTLEFDFNQQASANDLSGFLAGLPTNPSVVIKRWDDDMRHTTILEIGSIEFDSATNIVTIQ